MSKCMIISKIFYVLAIIFFVTYLCISKSYFMALGGVSLIIGSILMMIDGKKNK